MNGLGCAVRLRFGYYHQFHAYAFKHNTCVPYILKDGKVIFKNAPYNSITWGDSDQETKSKKTLAIEMGIQN